MALYGDSRLWQNPDLVAQDDDISWAVSFWFWKTRVHPKPGISDGYFGVSTNAINGGLECNGAAYQYKAVLRFNVYSNVLKSFNINETPIATGCY